MNKYQEALRIMCNGCEEASMGGCDGFNSKCHSYEPLRELVEKATPKKPIMLPMDGFSEEVASHMCCPNCKNPITNVWGTKKYEPMYCHYCGQRLDFGDEDED